MGNRWKLMGEEDLPMSWKETCPMTERMLFVSELLAGERTMSELCRRYGVSRKTGYKWLERFSEGGPTALGDRSHARHGQAQATSPEVIERFVALRQEHPSWGPRKLLGFLEGEGDPGPWPSASTLGQIWRRHGLVAPRRRRRTVLPRESGPLIQAQGPNELWCTDYKGQFRTGDARYCYPLTLSDAASRYLLLCRGLRTTSTAQARPWFERAFIEYGLPAAIRSDNGAPFSSCGLGGLSALSIWWIKLGVIPELIDPGCPQQNGRHERMHRTLKQEAIEPLPAANLSAQQRRFDRFVQEYNNQRPHEALGQRPPASVYRVSPRPYPQRLPAIEYPERYQVRQVRHNGEIKLNGSLIFVGEVLRHEPVGLLEVEDDIWDLYFGPIKLAVLDTYRMRLYPLAKQRKRHPPAQGIAPSAT
jgi:putative transposase